MISHPLILEYSDYERMKKHLLIVKPGWRYPYYTAPQGGLMLCDARKRDADLNQFAKLCMALALLEVALVFQIHEAGKTLYFVAPRRGAKGASTITREAVREAEKLMATL